MQLISLYIILLSLFDYVASGTLNIQEHSAVVAVKTDVESIQIVCVIIISIIGVIALIRFNCCKLIILNVLSIMKRVIVVHTAIMLLVFIGSTIISLIVYGLSIHAHEINYGELQTPITLFNTEMVKEITDSGNNITVTDLNDTVARYFIGYGYTNDSVLLAQEIIEDIFNRTFDMTTNGTYYYSGKYLRLLKFAPISPASNMTIGFWRFIGVLKYKIKNIDFKILLKLFLAFLGRVTKVIIKRFVK
jgi:hypothetical protein